MKRQLGTLLCIFPAMVAWSAGGDSTHTKWRSVGPAPPAVEAAIVADAASRTIYIGSLGGGMLESTDGGATFSPANNGLGATTISAMVMAPGNPDVVFANGEFDGFYKTIDGGANWYPIDGGGVSLVIDPSNPDILYAGLAPAEPASLSVATPVHKGKDHDYINAAWLAACRLPCRALVSARRVRWR